MLLRKMFRNTTSNPLEFFFLRRISRSSVINWLNKQMNEQMVTQQRYGPFELHSKISTRSNGRVSVVHPLLPFYLFIEVLFIRLTYALLGTLCRISMPG